MPVREGGTGEGKQHLAELAESWGQLEGAMSPNQPDLLVKSIIQQLLHSFCFHFISWLYTIYFSLEVNAIWECDI